MNVEMLHALGGIGLFLLGMLILFLGVVVVPFMALRKYQVAAR